MTLSLKMNNALTPQQLLEQQLKYQGLPNFGSIGGNNYGFSGMTGLGDGSGLGMTGGAGITGLSTAGTKALHRELQALEMVVVVRILVGI